MLLAFGDEEPVDLDVATTVFGQARAAGGRVGIAGWYHPYCRLFGAIADPCDAVSATDALFAFRRAAFASELGTLAMVPRLVTWHGLWSPEAVVTGGQPSTRRRAEELFVVQQRVDAYRRIHAIGLDMAADPSLSIVFLHYPAPHLPGFYSREQGNFDTTGQGDYLDNLALTNRTFGRAARIA